MTPSRRTSIRRLIFAGVALALAGGARASAPLPAKLSPLAERFAVSGQISPDQLPALKALGYTAIISLRPDGEGADQPSAARIKDAALRMGMDFAYVPVAPGAIPDAAVAALGEAIAANAGKVLLYCRSGSRAARAWGLAEASRLGGADADAIIATVAAAGQSADDLRAAIAQRVSSRPAAK